MGEFNLRDKQITVLYEEYKRIGEVIAGHAEAAFTDIKLFSSFLGIASLLVTVGARRTEASELTMSSPAVIGVILFVPPTLAFIIGLRHLIRRALLDYFQDKQMVLGAQLEKTGLLGVNGLQLGIWETRKRAVNRMNRVGYLYTVGASFVLPAGLVIMLFSEGPGSAALSAYTPIYWGVYISFGFICLWHAQNIRKGAENRGTADILKAIDLPKKPIGGATGSEKEAAEAGEFTKVKPTPKKKSTKRT